MLIFTYVVMILVLIVMFAFYVLDIVLRFLDKNTKDRLKQKRDLMLSLKAELKSLK